MTTKLPVRTVAKIWGRDRLPEPFSVDGNEKIGEIWFEPPATLPQLLVKYIFASENLSVQTHPTDTQAQAAGLGRQGKEECWIIIDAEPGATIAVGFSSDIGRDEMRSAAIDGSIEDRLVWHRVKPGDFFYIPANTVHAIGGGVSLLEIQQNSDITYRLYDYGRPRELHLDQGIAVAIGAPHSANLRAHVPETGDVMLVDGPYFRLLRADGRGKGTLAPFADAPLLVIPTQGEVTVDGERVGPGSCALAESPSMISLEEGSLCYLAQPLGK